jgi:hypothetical protein
LHKYINPDKSPFDNWFYFINQNHGICSALKEKGLYDPLMLKYGTIKDKPQEEVYVELLKPIGITVCRNYDYASALMSVNFLKAIYDDPQEIGEMLYRIANQRSNEEIVENVYEKEIEPKRVLHMMIGPPYCGNFHYNPTPSGGSLVSRDDKLIRYGFRKEITQQFIEKEYFIKYYMFWRDYEDCLQDFKKDMPITQAMKKFNETISKFRFPRSKETYHHFEHIII